MMKYTIKDVAKQANVSIATVSRVINNQEGYSEATRLKVIDAIAELGYQPNAVARGLISRKTNTIGVLVPSLGTTFVADLLSGIEKVAHQEGYSVIVCHTELQGAKTMKYLEILNEKRVDGIVFISAELKENHYQYIKKMRIPVVLLCSKSEQFPIPYVKVDDRAASYATTKYLIEKGHRNIGFISGSEKDRLTSIPRVEGYKDALRSSNIAIKERHIVFSNEFFFEDGVEGMNLLLKRASNITAVFAASDEIAVGAMSVAYKYGKKVPDDISVIGYDDLRLAKMSHPPLTSLSQPLYRMAEKATYMLFEMLQSNQISPSVIMPFSITERESVRSV